MAPENPISPPGIRDRPHIAPDGRRTDLGIQDVLLYRPTRHVDHRGSVFEAINFSHPFWSEPVIHAEWVVTSPGRIKGWGMHLEGNDRYVVGAGRLRVVLYDGRTSSASHGKFAEFHFSAESPGCLRIPTGVWHASQNYGLTEAIFVNFPTVPYAYADPDKYRIDPHDRSEIDFDWTLRDG